MTLRRSIPHTKNRNIRKIINFYRGANRVIMGEIYSGGLFSRCDKYTIFKELQKAKKRYCFLLSFFTNTKKYSKIYKNSCKKYLKDYVEVHFLFVFFDMKLQKYLAHQHICSRRKAEHYIRQGDILVNGEVAHIGQVVDPSVDTITVPSQLRNKKYTYILYHKPVGIVTVNPQGAEKSIQDITNFDPSVVPLGRLDKDTSGLILLTNDTKLQHQLLSPQHHVAKEYRIKIAKKIDPWQIRQLENGVRIGWYITKPAQVRLHNPNIIFLTITEGKNRQVRRMLRAVWNHVVGLRRVRLGKMYLWNIPAGQRKKVSKEDVI